MRRTYYSVNSDGRSYNFHDLRQAVQHLDNAAFAGINSPVNVYYFGDNAGDFDVFWGSLQDFVGI